MAGIPDEIIEEIRNRSDIVEVIGSFVQLKKSGAGDFKGLCPFHNEKTPSFHVNANNQMYYCYGCHKGGDVFKFYMERENMPFPDAVRYLASRTGVVIPENDFRNQSVESARQKAGSRERLFEINARASEFFCRQLKNSPQGTVAQYLKTRGLPQEFIERFKIGAAPDAWDELVKHCRSLGYRDDELIAAGVARRSEKSNRLYDFFRNRLVFTIENDSGRPVGFSARSLEAKPMNGGKYINTGETPLFHKGKLLYGLSHARTAIRDKKFAIICEGQMDAIAFHRAGFACAVAPLGSKFTEDQGKTLRLYTNTFCFAFDSDSAGREAMRHAVEICLPLSVDMKVIRIPGGKDPDELYKNGGADAVAAAVESARPWSDVIIEELPEHFDFSTPVGKSQAAAYMAELFKLVPNQVELESYVKATAEKLNVSPDAIYSELSKPRNTDNRRQEFARKKEEEEREKKEKSQPRRRYPAALLTLLDLALHSENTARCIADSLEIGELPDINPVSKAINTAINLALSGEYELLYSTLNNMLNEDPEPEIARIMVEKTDWKEPVKAVLDCIAEFRKVKKEVRKRKLHAALAVETDPVKRLEILKEINQLH